MKSLSKSEFEKRYNILFEIGTGAFGRVVKAYNKDKSKLVALKIINKRNDKDVEDFKHEVEMMKKAQCNNSVNIYDSFFCGKEMVIEMEFCGLGNISQYKSNMNNSTIAVIAREIAKVLSKIHKDNMLFLDVKPQNILLTSSGDIKLCDFGTMRNKDEVNQKNDVIDKIRVDGTMMYIAPEIINIEKRKSSKFEVTQKADIYSLGMSLFEMISGVPLSLTRNDSASEWFIEHNYEFINSTKEKKNYISKDISQLIIQMLSSNPEERPSAEDIIKQYSANKPAWLAMKEISCKPQRDFLN